MADTFTVTLPGNWRQRWPEVRAAAKKYNFVIKKIGDNIDFSGMGVAGNIRVAGSTAHVTIDEKPFYLSKSLIVSKVREFMTKYG
jgi:hypothetical protein